MDNTDYSRVTLEDGRTGYIVGPADDADDHVLVELDRGGEVSVPASALHRGSGATWTVNSSGLWKRDSDTVVPVIQEEVHVDRRKRVTGTVRVGKDVTEREETVSMPVARERADVRRVVIDQPVDVAPPVRREGDTIIFPVVEEVPIVRKQLVLKEEVHITRHRTTERHDETVVLRDERPVVDRLDAEGRQIAAEPAVERKPAASGGALGPPRKTGLRKNKIIRPD